MDDFDPLEAEVDAACRRGERTRALAAIREWRDHWLDRLGEGDRP